MIRKEDFFIHPNVIPFIDDKEYGIVSVLYSALDAFARTSYKSLYVVDYYKQDFLYVADNPLFLGELSADEVKEKNFEYYINHIYDTDLSLFLEVHNALFSFLADIPVENRTEYTLNHSFRIKIKQNKIIPVNHKITPLLLTPEGHIWLALCTVSISSGENMDSVEITHQYSRDKWLYNAQTQKWKKDINVIELSEEEKEVLRLVAQGSTMDKISNSMYKSIYTVKGYRKHIFEKFGTNSITQAVAYAINNKLI